MSVEYKAIEKEQHINHIACSDVVLESKSL